MRIASLLCWYDEAPSMLAAHVASLALAPVDLLVALDGAYVDYPGGRASSPIEQHKALSLAAESAGIELYSGTRADGGLFASEMEKRTELFRMVEGRADWSLVLDADEVVINAPNDFRGRLNSASCDVFEVPFLDDPHPSLGYAEDADGEPYVARARHIKYRRSIFRATSGVHVEGRHSRYIAGDGRVLWGDPLWGDEPVPAERMRDFVFDHRSARRGSARNLSRKAYYDRRDEKLLEGRPA